MMNALRSWWTKTDRMKELSVTVNTLLLQYRMGRYRMAMLSAVLWHSFSLSVLSL